METFAYDGTGRRVRTTRQDTTMTADEVQHTVDVFGSLVLVSARFEGGDYVHTANKEHVYLNLGTTVAHAFYAQQDLPTASDGQLHIFYALGDPLGSTSFVIDHDTGEVVERATYTAYGAAESDFRPEERWKSFREQVRYTGHRDNAEVGLIYFGARYLAPQLGRWISPDPLTIHGVSGDVNPYALVQGSPMRFVDPLGLGPEGTPEVDDNGPQYYFWDAIGNLLPCLFGCGSSSRPAPPSQAGPPKQPTQPTVAPNNSEATTGAVYVAWTGPDTTGYPYGHAGVILIDPSDESAFYTDFYPTGDPFHFDPGLVHYEPVESSVPISRSTIPSLVQTVSGPRANGRTTEATYLPNVAFDPASAYAQAQQQTAPHYNFLLNNCATFAFHVLEAGLTSTFRDPRTLALDHFQLLGQPFPIQSPASFSWELKHSPFIFAPTQEP